VRVVTPGRLLALGVVLLAVFLGLLTVQSSDYIFLPDKAHPVAPLVKVRGGLEPQRGGVYFVDVVVRKATLLEQLFGGLHEGADLYPASAINPPGVDDKQRRTIDLEDMKRSQVVAAAVAEKAAGKKVVMRAIGSRIIAVEPKKPADGKLEPDDVIVDLDSKRVRSPRDVFVAMKQHKVGDTVTFTIERGKKTLVEKIKTVTSGAKPPRPIVGVLLETAYDIRLPIPVNIDAGNVGGPSAGVAFALDVYEELSHDILHGNRIAATGEIRPDGSIGPIGGIKQKTIGARAAGVDAFLVPAGDNARDARKYADGLRIIPVETFPQALRALATLPHKT
jgi:PDZ domain-containing protein